jgi:phosphate starvation-inducible PhoH-like protein
MSNKKRVRRVTDRDVQRLTSNRKTLQPKSENQRDYIVSMVENDITVCTGPAGSGKSSVAVGLACDWLLNNKVERIIIARPAIEAGRGLGFLPGNKDEKIEPYLMPVLEEINQYIGKNLADNYRGQGIIELCPLEYMRGRNFHHCFMILDEAQNATYEQIKMFLTRIGMHSRAVVNGDLDQSDLPYNMRDGLLNVMNRLEDLRGVGLCELDASDIVRNPIIGRLLERLKQDR